LQPEVEPGDVIIVLQQKHHDKFQRSGDDLVMTHTITLTEALCGFCMVLKHLDGRDLVIKHPAGQVVKSGESYCVCCNSEYFKSVANTLEQYSHSSGALCKKC